MPSEAPDDSHQRARERWLGRIGLGAGVLGTVFWLYTFYGIGRYARPGDGTGMQWLGAVPLGFIFLVLTLPALILGMRGRHPEVAAVLGVLGLVGFAWLWPQLLGELRG